MTDLQIRSFCDSDTDALRRVFYTSVHQNALSKYTREQCEAWAPQVFDRQLWHRRMCELAPWVVTHSGVVVGYADLQPNGFIDHFYVAGGYARRGIGTMLLQHIHIVAEKRRFNETFSHVSLVAQPLFSRHGYEIDAHQIVVIRGVSFENARMHRSIHRC